MLGLRKVAARLPAKDLDRARAWYAEKLGLEAAEERPGGLRYVVGPSSPLGTGGCEFALFASAGESDGSFTQMGFEVADLGAAIAEMRRRGVVFEEYDLPGLRTKDGIARIEGNYLSKGSGEHAAWFRDSEGNLLGVGEPF